MFNSCKSIRLVLDIPAELIGKIVDDVAVETEIEKYHGCSNEKRFRVQPKADGGEKLDLTPIERMGTCTNRS